MRRLALKVIGGLFLSSPPILYWIIHGDYDRYLWIINGPFPLNQLGSWGPQLLLFMLTILIGLILLIISFKEKGDSSNDTEIDLQPNSRRE